MPEWTTNYVGWYCYPSIQFIKYLSQTDIYLPIFLTYIINVISYLLLCLTVAWNFNNNLL